MKSTDETRHYFPLFVNLWEQIIVIIGGGKVARRRIMSLSHFAGNITVIAPLMEEELVKLSEEFPLKLKQKYYEVSDIEDAYMVLAATDNQQVNQDIYQHCKERNILVNVCSDKSLCDFYFPAIIQKDNLVVGLAGGGTDHKRVKLTADKIRQLIN